MKICINGARGWLGRASLNAIFEQFPDISKYDLLLLGQESCELDINNKIYSVDQLGSADFLGEADIFIQLAFKIDIEELKSKQNLLF